MSFNGKPWRWPEQACSVQMMSTRKNLLHSEEGCGDALSLRSHWLGEIGRSSVRVARAKSKSESALQTCNLDSSHVYDPFFFAIFRTASMSLPVPQTPMLDEEELQKYIDDRRVVGYEPLVQPALLKHEIPTSPETQRTVARGRLGAANIIAGKDDRVLVIVGPCSIHDAKQAIKYAELLKSKIDEWDGLCVIMRAYLCVESIHLSANY